MDNPRVIKKNNKQCNGGGLYLPVSMNHKSKIKKKIKFFACK